MSSCTATSRALANVALVKYFGKRDTALNLPAAGSLSVALEPLATTTSVTFDSALGADEVRQDGTVVFARFAERVSGFLDIVRQLAGRRLFARVETSNSFPTGAGLASSASGFSALALAASRALELELDLPALSALARRGSGSAARSIPGRIAVWRAGCAADGSDSFAEEIEAPSGFDLRVVIGIADFGPKQVGSTDAMEHVRASSPYFESWIAAAKRDLAAAEGAVARGDFEVLGEITEQSALSMHAAALAARPGLVFWKAATIEALHLARALRKKGHLAYFTCDAGPQPKLLCRPQDEARVAEALAEIPGVQKVLCCRLGSGAELV